MANGDTFTIVKAQQVAIHAAQNGYIEYFGVIQFSAIGDTQNKLTMPFDSICEATFSPLGGFGSGEGEIGIVDADVGGVISRDANRQITIQRGAGGTTQKIQFRIRGY